jgi:hypothetical protein
LSQYVITPNLTANGNITPMSFVKGDTNNDWYCLQAGLNSPVIGVSQEGTNVFPDGSSTQPYAAVAGQTLKVYGPGSQVGLILGAGGCSRFQFLKSDANGNGIVASPGDLVAAYSLESGNQGQSIQAVLVPPGLQIANQIVTSATSLTLSPAHAGATVYITGTDQIVTLPAVGAVPAGAMYRIVSADTTTHQQAGTTGTQVAINAADIATVSMFASFITTPAAGKGALDAKANAKQGDTITVRSDGSNWWVTEAIGGATFSWTRQT